MKHPALALFLITCAALFGVTASLYSALPEPVNRSVDFTRDIQPILRDNCFDCHGAKKQEGGLRLDGKAPMQKGGDSGPAVVAGKSAQSLLIHAVAGLNEEIGRMPRKKEPLSAEQIGLLRAWIDQGATWPESSAAAQQENKTHWAYVKPKRPAVPTVKRKEWVKNPIDAFVLARLEKEGMSPSPETDRTTLFRRLHLDLIGLPPKFQEADRFSRSKDEKAYNAEIERLLASAHYGERWGRHWLDAARYADSDGFEKDKSRTVWMYRDYVVNAFNKNVPYDRFIIEQLAGDLLPNAAQEQVVATGFLRNSMLNEEGGVDPEQFRMEAMFDRMDAVGKSVLGITIQCAQCHNHKFDPLKQEEYFRMFAFLNNDHEPTIPVYTADEQMQREKVYRGIREIEAELQHLNSGWEEKLRAWEKAQQTNELPWIVLRPTVEDITTGGQRYIPNPDGSFTAQGYAPTKHTAKFWITNQLQNISAFQLEVLTDPNLPLNGPGRSFNGTFGLTEFKVEVLDAANPTNKQTVKFVRASSDFVQPVIPLATNFYDKTTNNRVTGPVEMAIDGDGNTAWGIDAGPGRRNQERKAVFVPEKPVGFASGTILSLQVAQNHGGWNSDDHMNNNLGRFRFSVVTNISEVTADPVPKRIRAILALPAEKRSEAQKAALFSYWRTTVPEFEAANVRIEALWKSFPTGTTALALQQREDPRETRMLKRGDFLKPGKPVQAGVPAFLHPLPEKVEPNRLTFAKWLVDKESPTTARVFVNRLWQSYFGTGLVATPEDLGLQSEAPSHPELLDWLACEFMDSGWDIKHMHRLILSSATYRQASLIDSEAQQKDPYNRLLARGSRFRVEGEIVRDIALAASGLLNPKVGGPSVTPPIPQHLLGPPVSYAPITWIDETGPDRYRRALYTFRRRAIPYPALQAFDVPNGDFSCVRRARSNTPIQALMSLNETVFVECAQGLARKVLEQGGDSDIERVKFAFREVLTRNPDSDELNKLVHFLGRQQKRIADGWLNATALSTGKEPLDLKGLKEKGITPAQLAGYTALARVLLNLDETITRE